MIPEAYRFALVWGINPFTGTPSPAGKWIVRNVVDWCRRNPTPGEDGDKFRRATSDIVVATVSPNRWWDSESVRVPSDAEGTRPLYDWWDLASDPYPGAHYAVWPPEVARRLIVTMCPLKVCATCGEPQRRIVAPTDAYATKLGNDMFGHVNDDRQVKGRHGGQPPAGVTQVAGAERVTTGWTDCGHDTWRAGMILDPFAGSGTTGAVATGNSRDAILVDIDERNVDLGFDRIGGLFLEVREMDPT